MSRLIMQTDAEDLVKILSHDAKLFTFVNNQEDDLKLPALAKVSNAERQAAAKADSAKVVAAKPKSPLATRLEATGASKSDVTAFLKAEAGDTSALNVWLTATPVDVARRTVELAVMKHARLVEIQALLASGALYAPLKVIEWARMRGLAATTEALAETAADTNEAYVQKWLEAGATASSAPSYKKLIRLEARVQAGVGALYVYQRDRDYVSSQDPPSMTGFLRYDFGGDIAEVHTHWNKNKRKLVSMHVQEAGNNSTEIHKWLAFFPTVPGAVLSAHNAATGNRVPTTLPPGAGLTL